MEVIKQFFADYGYSFLMMIIAGAVIAILLEITVKKVFEWLEPKFDEKGKKILAIVKAVVIQALTWLGCIVFTKLIVDNMPLPGGKVFIIIWVPLVYCIQYVFSMYGIKGLIELWRKHKEPKAEKPNPVEGMKQLSDNLYVNALGQYFTKDGKRL